MGILNSDILTEVYFGNSVETYVVAFGTFIVFWVVLRFLQLVILKKLSKLSLKTETEIDDVFIKIFKSIRPKFYTFLSFYLALLFVSLDSSIRKWLGIILLVFVVFQVIKSIQVLIDFVIDKKIDDNDKESESAFRFLSNLLKWTLWIVGLILILSNLGVNVNSLIAGFGIGGIAIAMAVQGILGDVFSALSIYFDKPFRVGDTIKIGDDVGTVEKIGIKTTRLRSLQNNEELVVSNRELTSSRIQNFREIKERRVALRFGVLYNTPNEKMKTIPSIVEKIVNGAEKARFDRAHFTSFNASSLDFEVIYFIESSDYTEFLNAQQKINLELKETFEKEKIGMAYPTQTIYLEK